MNSITSQENGNSSKPKRKISEESVNDTNNNNHDDIVMKDDDTTSQDLSEGSVLRKVRTEEGTSKNSQNNENVNGVFMIP